MPSRHPSASLDFGLSGDGASSQLDKGFEISFRGRLRDQPSLRINSVVLQICSSLGTLGICHEPNHRTIQDLDILRGCAPSRVQLAVIAAPWL